MAAFNTASSLQLENFIRRHDIHAYLLVKDAPPRVAFGRVAPTRPALLAAFLLLAAAYAAALTSLVVARHPLFAPDASGGSRVGRWF